MASSAASRAQEAAADALDRRVRPILDQVDLRNYKQAVKLADAAIKKYGDHPLYRTVKAMALERMGRKQEALDLVTDVRSGPLNEHLLGMMQPIYRNLGRYDEATKGYEKFAAEDPQNPERQIQLFNAYAREYDYLKQQQVAMKLFKQLGREQFLMWAVCTLELQALAEQGGPTGGGARMLQLAEALLRKKMGLARLEGLESLLVFLSILELQHKHAAALELIQGPAGALFTLPADKARVEGELQHKLGHYKESAAAFASVLRISPDDWAAFQAYVDALLEYREVPAQTVEAAVASDAPETVTALEADNSWMGPGKRTRLSFDEVERRLGEAHDLVAELQAVVVQSGELLRGLFLAKVELEKRRAESGEQAGGATQGQRRVAEAIVKYFDRHGTMVSFAPDVRQHVLFITDPGVAGWLAAQLQQAAERSAAAPDCKPVHALRRRIAAAQVEEQLGLVQQLPDAELYARAERLAEVYQASVPLLHGVAPRERGPAEELLVMAATCLVEGYVRTGERARLLEAILVLEQGLFDRRWQSEYKLMLVSLYLHAGAVGPALGWYRLLDIKHIQAETMAHHVLPALLASAQRDAAAGLLRELAAFHDGHLRDGADMTLTAYRNGTFSKVREFVRFKERLERSHQRLAARTESLLLRLAEAADNPTEAQALLADVGFGREPLAWSTSDRLAALSFNEDLATRPWWTPTPEQSLLDAAPLAGGAARQPWHAQEAQSARVARDARWRRSVRRRCLLPRLLALTLDLGPVSAAQAGPPAAEQATHSERGPAAKASDKSGRGKGKKKSGNKSGDVETAAGEKREPAPTSNGAAGQKRETAPREHGGENGCTAAHGSPQSPVDEMRQLVDEYARTLRPDTHAGNAPDAGPSSPGGAQPLDELSLAVFTTSLRIMEARDVLAGSGTSTEGAAQAAAALPAHFQSILARLHGLDETLAGQLFSDLPTAGASLRLLSPGRALPQLATLVHEAAAWLLLALHSWARVFPASLKRKKKTGTEDDGSADARTLAVHALQSLVSGVEAVFRSWADRLTQYLAQADVHALAAALKAELSPTETGGPSSQAGRVLTALQSWSRERQVAIMQTREQSRGGGEEENDEAVLVLDLEAVLRASLESSSEVLEQIRTASLLKANLFKKLNV
ncbi:hypothetical protein KFL_005350050 [Klebsormidium nitens]|uniref:Uncharacterized protein n=1 Tax=Klebsormidium nitens TaxID=105231 RepID=A0A1Y1IF88_KLENI|nr:hypothetical protein KFL_005350050 [Klebsormidium nitens]|eukprot:GAQ89550.1 hypothetical protein KFL_005350050 [Klebsormidium nitens]